MQNLGNKEEIVEHSQILAKLEKESALPSSNKPVEPILEGNLPSSSRDKGKHKVGKESPNLEKEAQNPSAKVTKSKRFILVATIHVASIPVMPQPKQTCKIVEVKDVPVRLKSSNARTSILSFH